MTKTEKDQYGDTWPSKGGIDYFQNDWNLFPSSLPFHMSLKSSSCQDHEYHLTGMRVFLPKIHFWESNTNCTLNVTVRKALKFTLSSSSQTWKFWMLSFHLSIWVFWQTVSGGNSVLSDNSRRIMLSLLFVRRDAHISSWGLCNAPWKVDLTIFGIWSKKPCNDCLAEFYTKVLQCKSLAWATERDEGIDIDKNGYMLTNICFRQT